MLEVQIPESNLSKLESKIGKLTKIAAKLGVETPVLRIGEPVLQAVSDNNEAGDSETRWVKVFPCTVSGEAPKLAGWSFLATLQFLSKEDGTLVLKAPGVQDDLAKYRVAEPWCDHCRTIRYRKDTYLVRGEAGEVKQVGSSCLRDFLGHVSPEQVAQWLAMIEELRSMADDEEMGERVGGGVEYTPIKNFLPWVVQVVLLDGWVSRQRAEETGQPRTGGVAAHAMESRSDTKDYRHYKPTEQAKEIAASIPEKVAALAGENDYEYALKTLFKFGGMERRNVNLVASAVLLHFRAVWQAEREAKQQQAGAQSKWLGEIGQRIDFTGFLESANPISSDFGYKAVYKFKTQDGNRVVWFGTVYMEPGRAYKMRGTVQKHGEWKGVKETVVARCKMLAQLSEQEEQAAMQGAAGGAQGVGSTSTAQGAIQAAAA